MIGIKPIKSELGKYTIGDLLYLRSKGKARFEYDGVYVLVKKYNRKLVLIRDPQYLKIDVDVSSEEEMKKLRGTKDDIKTFAISDEALETVIIENLTNKWKLNDEKIKDTIKGYGD